jgi:hypothetical protein
VVWAERMARSFVDIGSFVFGEDLIEPSFPIALVFAPVASLETLVFVLEGQLA